MKLAERASLKGWMLFLFQLWTSSLIFISMVIVVCHNLFPVKFTVRHMSSHCELDDLCSVSLCVCVYSFPLDTKPWDVFPAYSSYRLHCVLHRKCWQDLKYLFTFVTSLSDFESRVLLSCIILKVSTHKRHKMTMLKHEQYFLFDCSDSIFLAKKLHMNSQASRDTKKSYDTFLTKLRAHDVGIM